MEENEDLPQEPSMPQPPQRPVDMQRRKPCPCGSGELLKDCCFDKVEPWVGYVIADADNGNVPVFVPHKDDDGNPVDNALDILVFDTYKNAAESLQRRYEKVVDQVRMRVVRAGVKELEEFAEGYSDLLSQRLEAEIDIYLIIPDNIHPEEEGPWKAADGGQAAGGDVVTIDPPYSDRPRLEVLPGGGKDLGEPGREHPEAGATDGEGE